MRRKRRTRKEKTRLKLRLRTSPRTRLTRVSRKMKIREKKVSQDTRMYTKFV